MDKETAQEMKAEIYLMLTKARRAVKFWFMGFNIVVVCFFVACGLWPAYWYIFSYFLWAYALYLAAEWYCYENLKKDYENKLDKLEKTDRI